VVEDDGGGGEEAEGGESVETSDRGSREVGRREGGHERRASILGSAAGGYAARSTQGHFVEIRDGGGALAY
jgi:hypothetical protein